MALLKLDCIGFLGNSAIVKSRFTELKTVGFLVSAIQANTLQAIFTTYLYLITDKGTSLAHHIIHQETSCSSNII